MSLETHIAGVDDALVSPLHFSGSASTASYITERRNCTFAPKSGGLFSPNGLRLLRFNLADQSGFLDGQTIRLAFEIKNTHATVALTPVVSSPAIPDFVRCIDDLQNCPIHYSSHFRTPFRTVP